MKTIRSAKEASLLARKVRKMAFPKDVCQKTGKKEHEVHDELREQVLGVLSSMREAIKQAEDKQYKKDAPIREKIR